VSVAGATLVRVLIDPFMAECELYFTYYVAVVVAAWFGGWKQALLAVTLGALCALWFLVPPRYEIAFRTGPDALDLLAYVFAGLTIAALSGGMHAARRRAEKVAGEALARQKQLEAEVALRQRAEAVVRQREAQLAEADRRKDEFLATLAHELRNPLAAIRNALDVSQLRAREGGGAVGPAGPIIRRQVGHLARLVDDLLDVSRIARGKVRLRKRFVDVAEVISSAVESSRPLIDARGHHLEVALPDTPMRIDADPTRIAQVLVNLLSNAAKYTPDGGRIWLTVERGGGQVILRVRDTGLGIPAPMLPQIFDLYTQVAGTFDRAEGGLGIGLTLVRRLTEMHSGTVSAFSAGPGAGSEFVVRLPLLPEKPRAAAAEDSDSAGRARAPSKRRILIVDDNRDSADCLAELLRLAGHDVRAAYDGRQALAAAAAHRPDLVLLDIGLPDMDGFAVARQLRSRSDLAGVVLVALTGHGSDEVRRRSREAGFDHYLVKPVDPGALQEFFADPGPREGDPASQGLSGKPLAPVLGGEGLG
jgi:signal transduction histidine kinase/CheY-like chemotaxis protein